MRLQDKLRLLRVEQGITQEAAARKLNVSSTSYARWELGIHKPSGLNVYKLAKLYNTTVEDLLSDATA